MNSIKRDLVWLFILTKRQIFKASNYIISLILILLIFLSNKIFLPSSSNMKVLICMESESIYGERLLDSLKENESVFSYEECVSSDILKHNVMSGDYECGFVIRDGFDEKIENGDIDDSILYLSSIYTTKGEAIKESIFSEFFKIYGEVMLKNKQEYIFGDFDKERFDFIVEDYNRLLESGDVFDVVYEVVDVGEDSVVTKMNNESTKAGLSDEIYDESGEYSDSSDTKYASVQEKTSEVSTYSKERSIKIRGYVMLILFMIIFLSYSARYSGDLAKHCIALKGFDRQKFKVIYLNASGFMIFAIGFICIRFCDSSICVWEDFFVYLIFGVLCVAFTYIIGSLPKDELSYLAFALIVFMGHIIFTPIIFDESKYVGVIYYISYFFPTGAYMRVLELFAL